MFSLLVGLALATGWATPGRPAHVSDANVALACQWPTVVSFRAGEDKCSGTLVHPRVIVTAAHCLDDSPAGAIRFGEQFQPAARIVDAARCGLDPDYLATGAPSSDIGWCVLDEAIEDIPPTPLLMGCETGLLREGEPAVIVGLGISPNDDEFGTKRYAFTTLDSDLRDDGTVWVGDAEVNGCFGDSGGPAFVQAPGGTWHTVGVLAFGPDCGQGPVLYRTLHDRIGWLEQQTGVDLSPCHDADGQWAPGPECGSLAAGPLTRDATWDDQCAGQRRSAPACTEFPAPALDSPDEPDEPPTTDGTLDTSPSSADEAGCSCRSGTPARAPWALLLILGLGAPTRPRRPRTESPTTAR